MRRPYFFSGFVLLVAAILIGFAIRAEAKTAVEIFNGGTGTSTAPAYGQLLIGGKNGEYELVASSTLGSTAIGFSTTSAVYWLTQQSTSNLTEGSNLYFTNARAISALTGQSNSIFTNGAGYLTSLTGAASSTLLGDTNTWTHLQSFSNATSTLFTSTTAWIGTLNLTNPLAVAQGGTGLTSTSQNFFFAGPTSGSGAPTWRAIVAADVPTLNQNTTGSAATLTTARTINGVSFNGSANITIAAASSSLLTDNDTFSGNLALATTTTGSLNGVITVNGFPYPKNNTGITEALAQCGVNGINGVFLTSGSYSITAPINIPSNCEFYGAGVGKTIFTDGSGSVLTQFFNVSTISNVSMHDFSILGNGSTVPTGIGPADGIDDIASINAAFYNIGFSHINDAALNVQSSGAIAASSTDIYNIYSDCTVAAPIYISSDTVLTPVSNTMIHNIPNLCGNDSAVAVFNSTSTKMWAININKTGTIAGQGVEIGSQGAHSNVQDMEAWGITVVGAFQSGVSVAGTTTTGYVNDSSASYSGTSGFNLNAAHFTFKGDTSSYNQQDGFRVIAGNSSIVSRPMLTDNYAIDNNQSGLSYCGMELNAQSSGSIIGAQITTNTFLDDQATTSPQYGLCFVNTGTENGAHNITGNVFSGNAQSLYFTPGQTFVQSTMFNNPGSTSTTEYLGINGSASTTLFSTYHAFFDYFSATSTTATSTIFNLNVGRIQNQSNAASTILVNQLNTEGALDIESNGSAGISVPLVNIKQVNGSDTGNAVQITGNSAANQEALLVQNSGTAALPSGAYEMLVQNTNSSDKQGGILLNLKVTGNQSSGIDTLVTNGGLAGFGTTTPWGFLSLAPASTTLPMLVDWFQGSSSPAFIIGGANQNGNIGIATTTPGSLLSIQGIVNFTTATSTFYGNGLNITNGCYAVNGTCLTQNSGTVTSVSGASGITGSVMTSGSLSLDQSFGAVWTAASSTYTNHLSLNTASTSQFSSPTIWDSTVGNALWLGDANGKATAYAGSNPCTNQVALSLSAVGVVGCTTVSNAMLAHSTIVLNNQTLTLGDSGDTITAASSTLLANNNNFSGNNIFTASTTFQAQINAQGASTTLLSANTGWIGTLNLTNALSVTNGGTGLSSIGASSTILTTNGTLAAWQKIDVGAAVYGVLPIANGGTATTTGGNTNAIEYYGGSNLTNNSHLQTLFDSTGNWINIPYQSSGQTNGVQIGLGDYNSYVWQDYGAQNDTLHLSANYYKNNAGSNIINSASFPTEMIQMGYKAASGSGGVDPNGGIDFETGGAVNVVPSIRMDVTDAGLVGIASSTPWGQLSLAPGVSASTTPQFVSWVSGSSTPAFIVNSANNNGSVGVGTTTFNGVFGVGPDANSASTTISGGKLQWDGYDSGGTRRCWFFVSGGALTSVAGACTP